MLLTVRDLSVILKVSEGTVYRWIRDSGLPAREVHGHYRAHPVAFLEWLADHPVPVDPQALPTEGAEAGLPSLEAAIRAGGVYPGVPGTSRQDVFAALADRLPPVRGLPAADLRFLLQRAESVGTEFLRRGLAVPSARHPLIESGTTPMLAVTFPENLITWNDAGAEVRVIFTLICPTVRLHLRLLARLIFALHDRAFDNLLQVRATPERLLEAARQLDHVTAQAAPARGARS
jgi:PTS system nitrogen regulatory IIA component